jgi:hypothetical protein
MPVTLLAYVANKIWCSAIKLNTLVREHPCVRACACVCVCVCVTVAEKALRLKLCHRNIIRRSLIHWFNGESESEIWRPFPVTTENIFYV